MIQPDDLPTPEEYVRANPVIFSIDKYMDKYGQLEIARISKLKEDKIRNGYCHYCKQSFSEELYKWNIIEQRYRSDIFFICCPDCFEKHPDDHGLELTRVKHEWKKAKP